MSRFKIKVISIQKNTVNLASWILEPQQNFFYDEENFVLQLLWDGISPADKNKCPLGKEITVEKISTAEWLLQNAASFIKTVQIKQTKNYPISEKTQNLTGKEFDTFWNKPDNLPYADYVVEVTNSKWITHLKKNKTWTSSAHNYELG